MNRRKKLESALVLIGALLLSLAGSVQAEAGRVEGWFKAGTDPSGYEIGTVETEQGRAAYIRSLDPKPKQFGTLMQSFDATSYLGQRIRLRAMVRTHDVRDNASMWMRVDAGERSVAFDNMQDRPLVGTLDWQEYSIVLDVPEHATGIFMGIILAGEGRAEWRAIKFETVSTDVPLTCMINVSGRHPKNLDFAN